MTSVATKRLIDASAELGPDDRALLSLLINHGLDDGALARLTRAGRAEVAARRELLAERLGTVLELPPATIQNALDELAGTARVHRAEPLPSHTDGNHTHADSAAATVPTPAPAATPHTRVPRDQRAVRDHRRAVFAWLATALVVVVALVIALAGGSGSPGRSADKGKAASTAGRKAVQPQVLPLSRGSLVGLPGGPPGVSGTVAIIGAVAHPQLTVAVSGLPAVDSGHYEVWLYNSIIDSVPLGALGAPGKSVMLALPPEYRRYRWLDVSLQPAGSINHSGESVLRAAVPAG